MHPPDSYNPYQPPAYGQQPPGQYPGPYPPQYPAQYPGQYPPQYAYPYYGPPPRQDRPGRIVAIVVVVVVLVIVLPIIIAGVLIVYLQTLPYESPTVETNLGLRVEPLQAGGWLLSVVSGTKTASSVTLQVINPSTGAPTVSKLVSSLAPAYSDPDARYNDNNGNNRLDAGDTIQLKASGGHIVAGYKVQILVGDSIVGMIKELPA